MHCNTLKVRVCLAAACPMHVTVTVCYVAPKKKK